jgi:hypothetical protein
MSARIVNLGSPAHQNAQDLLAWFVMGTLDDVERAMVDEHVRGCAVCQRDVAWHQQLREANNEPAPVRDVDRAFAALRARLPAPSVASARSGRMASDRNWLNWVRPWSGWALALQTLVILGLASVLWFGSARFGSSEPAQFHALGRAGAALTTARLVVVFAPQASAAEMRRVLLASRTRIVDGPTAADAYILAVAPDHAEQAMQQLRAEHSVLLIQSLDAKDAH